MKKWLLIFGVLCLFLALLMVIHTAHADEWAIEAMNKQVDDTNFLVNESCSGTKVSDRLILTADHCIKEQFKDIEREEVNDKGEVTKKVIRIAVPGYVSQKFFEGVRETRTYSYRYHIKAHDGTLDLSLLETDAPLPKSGVAGVACQNLLRGNTVYAVGNPHVVLYATVTKGIVSSVQRNYEQLEITNGYENAGQSNGFFQFTAPIAPGSSGGAVYNDRGELVGVVVRGGNGNIGLGVPLSDVRAFLQDNGVPNDCEDK